MTVRIEAMMTSSSRNSNKRIIQELRGIESRFKGQVSLKIFEMDSGGLVDESLLTNGILGQTNTAIFIEGVRLETSDDIMRDFASIVSKDTDLACRTVILGGLRKVAVVGASRNEDKPANYVPQYLSENGFEIFPVNPNAGGAVLFGRKCAGKLSDLEGKSMVDVVNVFRPAREIDGVVDDAIRLKGIAAIWVQSGIKVSDETIEKAVNAGIIMIIDECMMTRAEDLLHET